MIESRADPEIFARGGGGGPAPTDSKFLTTFYFSSQLNLQRRSNFIFQGKLTIFGGGPSFSSRVM